MDDGRHTDEDHKVTKQRGAIEQPAGAAGTDDLGDVQREIGNPRDVMRERVQEQIRTTGEDDATGNDEPVQGHDPSGAIEQPGPDLEGETELGTVDLPPRDNPGAGGDPRE